MHKKNKILNGKKIKIRKISKKDLKNVKKFQEFINFLVDEEVKITISQKRTLREEVEWLKRKMENIKKHQEVFLVAESSGEIVGTTGINLSDGRQNHVANFGITIRQGYRGIGLGKYMMGEILKLAKKELKPKPRIFRLSVFANNKPAIKLYKKYGFKEVARIPKQLQRKGKLVDEVIMLRFS